MLGPVSAWVGDRLWTGKPPRHGTKHPGLFSLACLCAGWNEYLAKAGGRGVNRHIVWCTSPYPWSRKVCWMPGWWLASGDHRRLTGSSSALEACSRRCAIQFTLLYKISLLPYISPRHSSLSMVVVAHRGLCIDGSGVAAAAAEAITQWTVAAQSRTSPTLTLTSQQSISESFHLQLRAFVCDILFFPNLWYIQHNRETVTKHHKNSIIHYY